MEEIITVEKLTKRTDPKNAVNNLNLSVKAWICICPAR